MSDRIDARADFSALRYAQLWEDADVLRAGLELGPGDRVWCIASAGDNALALLLDDPAEVVAFDLSAAQLAAVELRIAAFRALDHAGLVRLVGARSAGPDPARLELYRLCRRRLGDGARAFWDAQSDAVAHGIGNAGRFERYLDRFRRWVLPLTQSRARVARLAAGGGTAEERLAWYDARWDTARWRALFRVFASRFVLGRTGRDPRFFDHVEGRVADRLMARIREAVTATDPADNPYLQRILLGRAATALPPYLRTEAFDTIRARVDRVELRRGSLEDLLAAAPDASVDAFALSDLFEYVSEAHTEALLAEIARVGRPGARVAYWNLLAPRARPASLADRLDPMPDLARRLHARDRAPFYRAFRVERVLG